MSEPARPRPEDAAALRASPLGRWLAPTSESRIERIPCRAIDNRVWPPATSRDDLMVALCQSVRERGVVEPLLLRPEAGGRFSVVLGARRLVAARAAGLGEVPAIVRELDDAEATLLAAWSALPRTSPRDGVELAARLTAAGVGDAEAAALLTALGAPARITPERVPQPWRLVGSSRGLRFAGAATPVHTLLDGLGERRATALRALSGIDPEHIC